jgi:mono/diheme cytochrome c family protein
MRNWLTVGSSMGLLILLAAGPPARATVEMQDEAKALGWPVHNCLYCHASPHAVEKMKDKARELDMAQGNCLLCHGREIPATLNDRGQWLVEERDRRDVEKMDMAWLKDYKEPPPGEDGTEADTPKE